MAGDREQKFSALVFELWYLLKQQDFSRKYMEVDLCEFCLFFTLLIIKNKPRHMPGRHRGHSNTRETGRNLCVTSFATSSTL